MNAIPAKADDGPLLGYQWTKRGVELIRCNLVDLYALPTMLCTNAPGSD